MDEDLPISPVKRMKKWMSEPTLLGDYEDNWIKECKDVQEDSVSFTDEVAQPSLTHVTKERVQFRPKRRPPSRDFLRSRASMDFDISIPEEIEEEVEPHGKDEKVEKTENEVEEEDISVKVPVPPPKPPKDPTGWKLPNIDSEVRLKKTPVKESKSSGNNTTKPITTSEGSTDIPEAPTKQKRRPKLKFPLFSRFNRNRRGKDNDKNGAEPETKNANSNLSKLHYGSLDSGSRPLGDEPPKRWRPYRHRKAEERRNLNWLLALFHRRNSSHGNSAQSATGGPPIENGNHGDTNLNNICDVEREKYETNGNVSGNKTDEDFTNGSTPGQSQSHDDHESVSDLRKKFERI